MVFEKAGKLDDAIESYGQALELAPDNPQLLGNAARARVRRGDKDDQLRQLLADLVMKDERPEWREWARKRLALMGGPPASRTEQN